MSEVDVKSLVKNLFLEKNRPFGANEVILSLQKHVSSKAQIQKSIDVLVEEGTVIEKIYGKQKVYVYNQALFPQVNKAQIQDLDHQINDVKIKLQECQQKEGTVIEKIYGKQKVYVYNQALFPQVNKAQIQDLDHQINDVKIKLQECQQKVKVQSAELSKMNSMPTLQKVKKQFEDLSAKEAQLSAKISQIKSDANSVDPKVRQAIMRDHEIFTKEAKKRARWCGELIDMILEQGYPSTKHQLMQEIGIDRSNS